MHVALRRRGEEALGAFAEVGGGDSGSTARDKGIVLGKPAEFIDCAQNRRIAEGDLVRHPLVIGLG